MCKFSKALAAAFCALALFAPTLASATDGYMNPGEGMKAEGRGGTATAVTDDAFGGGNNPATMVFVGDRLDKGITLFNPLRSASRTGLGPGLDGTSVSGSDIFGVPELGYNHMLSPSFSLGVSVYGNGGMNTTYQGAQFNCGQGSAQMLCGNGTLGVNLVQLIVAPTLAVKLGPKQSFGIAPQLGYQQFAAEGLQAFMPMSNAPSKVTNNGASSSYGAGVRFGYFAQPAPWLTFGATYATKMSMSKFDKYAGLFAGGGSFDIPENFGFGVTVRPVRALMIAADYERINYRDVPAVGNPSTNQAPLGSPNGPGFGWQDTDIMKLGLEYTVNPKWTLRAGYNHTTNPITSRDVTFNILAPGVVTDHVTAGVTHLTGRTEVTVAVIHAFNNKLSGASMLPAFMGQAPAGTETIQLRENSIGISVGQKF